jgi:hypothetical protein
MHRCSRPPHRSRHATVILLVAAAATCSPSDPGEPGDQPSPGLVEPGGRPALLTGVVGEEPDIQVPDAATGGEELTVRVTTYGLDGCWSKGETAVSVEDMTATVRPYDHEPTGDRICTQAIQEFSHEATLTFDRAGTGRVVVEGRRLEDRAAVSFVREVEVREAGSPP